MNPLKKLASQTAIYGLSSIVGRTINYLFVPFYTRVFTTDQFGVYTEMYAYVAFLIVLLTYGMETTFFRFSGNDDYESEKVFSTGLVSLIASSALFIISCIIFSQSIADWLNYPDHSEYIVWFALIIGLDAVSSLPLAKLRKENKPGKFALVNLSNIGVYILLNLFFLVYIPHAYENGGNFLTDWFYDGEVSVGMIFIANLIASTIKLAIMYKELISVKLQFVFHYWKKMIIYALPMMMVGFMGIINETFDRIILKQVLEPKHGIEYASSQLGIYGANYKIAMIMTMFVQAFRYAAEPFFFGKEKDGDKMKNLATVFKMLTVILSAMFLGVVLFQDVVMYFIGEDFREGGEVVPILLLANLFLGLLVNVSMWYKLTNNTHLGALLSLGGALVTVVLNFVLIPSMSYVGSAWATLIVYFLMLVGSIAWGRKYYPVNYPIKRAVLYIGSVLFLHLFTMHVLQLEGVIQIIVNISAILAFAALVYALEKPKKIVLSKD